MRKFNPNEVLFVFVSLFIIVGILGNYSVKVIGNSLSMLKALVHFDIDGAERVIDVIDTGLSEELSYHDILMDLDSLKNNLIGTKVVFKEDTTVVKTNSGSLTIPVSKMDSEEIKATVSRIKELETIVDDNGGQFLYCLAPTKQLYETMPCNVDNYSKENYECFVDNLAKAEIPVLNLVEVFRSNNTQDSDLFFFTDHHWKARTAFFAYSAICDKLSDLYNFDYNKEYTYISNYDINYYSNWFLGSYGKKVGTYFTWHGADDFELIRPKFETSFVEEEPLNGNKKEGSFEETVLCMDNIEKNYYHKNAYAVYSGGDYRLQVIKNNQNTDGKKIIILRDSFACAVTPFLALQASELYICDMRDFLPEEKMNMAEFIEEQKPDYVIVLYSGVHGVEKGGRFDFF